jgi:N-acetylmuramic acid 6-phosphate etherase
VIAGGDKALRLPVEHAEDDTEQGWKDLQEHQISNDDVVVGLAASGTTPYVIAALAKARTEGIFTGCITCNPDSPLSKVSDVKIEVLVGPEYVTGSTRMKSGTAEKMILNMISTASMIQLGRVKGNKMLNMQLTNAKLINRGTRMIMDELGLDYEPAKRLLEMHGSVKKVLEMNKK